MLPGVVVLLGQPRIKLICPGQIRGTFEVLRKRAMLGGGATLPIGPCQSYRDGGQSPGRMRTEEDSTNKIKVRKATAIDLTYFMVRMKHVRNREMNQRRILRERGPPER